MLANLAAMPVVSALVMPAGLLVTVGVYGVLFLLGLVEGIIGSFQYARTAGSVPVAALVCCAVILATCLLAMVR